MDTTIVLQAFAGTIFNPVVLGSTTVVSLAFLTGSVARVAELLGRS